VIAIPLESAANGSDRGSGKLLIDFVIHARAAKFGGDADSVLDGVGI
jgi:hypothetical protein